MRILGFTLLSLALALAAVPAAAQDEGQTTFDLEGYAEDGEFYFTFAGGTERNPTLVVPAGAEITVNFHSISGLHNVHVEGQDAGDFVDTGESTTYTFTAPDSGTVAYWCDPHRSAGMEGVVRVAGADGDDGPVPGDNGTPGAGVLLVTLAGLGAALLARRT